MKIAIINVDCGTGGSTGRIALEIAQRITPKVDEVLFAYGRSGKKIDSINTYKISNDLTVYLHGAFARLFDADGRGSILATRRLIRTLERFKPDEIWIHNLHGYYINTNNLFKWLRKNQDIKVHWLLHDCWAFTGHCSYFTAVKCEKWKNGCNCCPQTREYPKSYVDNSKNNYIRKKELFTGLKNLELVTPSNWLASLVKLSYLKEYPVVVRNNTIDYSIFKPQDPAVIKELYNVSDKKVILGVANIWNARKGLEDFIRLREKISTERYAIILVGLNRKQIDNLPEGIIGIERTNSATELAQLYSAADVFINPTYEDNYPTTNLEAKACGTPVITYNTGGSPESTLPENVVDVGDIEGLIKRITIICGQDVD